MNTNADAFAETATSGGLEDGELDSEKEESATVATNSRKLRECFNLNLVKIDNEDNTTEDFPRILHRFQDASMRCSPTDDIMENDIDEYEMICIRGGSPPKILERDKIYMSPDENNFNDASYFYESDESLDMSRAPRRNRKRRKDRSRKRRRSRRNHRSKDKLDVRENNGKGEKSTKNSSPAPNDENHPTEDKIDNRKLEICKFYLMDCCIKSHICHYMHADFPCKYFYLGLECENEKPCKFLHGKALNEDMKTALIRHIIAAPRAILGNFKRMSKERVESMLEARNAQLLLEEGGSGTQTIEEKQNGSNSRINSEEKFQNGNDKSNDTKYFNTQIRLQNSQSFEQMEKNCLDPGLNQSLQNFPEVFTEAQYRALSKLGITCLQQINHLSLAKLTEIGLSVVQINELQQKSERAHNARLQNSKNSRSTENYLKLNDPEFKMVPTVEEKMRELNFQESEKERQNFHLEKDIACTHSLLEDILNPSNAVFDELSTLDLLDDESKLVIDESAGSESENENKQSQWCTEDYEGAKEDKNASDFVDNNETRASCSEIGLTFSERIDRDIQSSALVSVRGDFDMRMPFVPVADFIPATEIQASISSHEPIKYKLTEIYIPKRQQSIELNDLNENNLLDPRLKRNLQLQNNNVSEDNQPISSDAPKKSIDKPPTSSNSSNTHFGGLSSDPRKRKEAENSSAQLSLPNFQSILNGYLQKSRWYQEQKSHVKIHINQLLARLSSELGRFHQNANVGACFELWDMELAEKIDEVLFNLGIQIDAYGNICEGATEMNSPTEGGISRIPSLLTLNVSDGPANFHGYPPPGNIPPFLSGNLLPSPVPRLDMPKPGLLGIAPGIEYPPHFPLQPPNPALVRFQREMVERHHRWQNCPPGTPFYHPQRPIGPPLGHPFDVRRGICENMNENRRRCPPFERRGIFKRLKRF